MSKSSKDAVNRKAKQTIHIFMWKNNTFLRNKRWNVKDHTSTSKEHSFWTKKGEIVEHCFYSKVVLYFMSQVKLLKASTLYHVTENLF